jgi:uncharacterized repeat protein (TIGR01451 family)
MTINLSDIPAATSAYIDNEVDVEILNATANLEPGEEGTYTVRVTNASAPTGVRLNDVILHLTVSPDTVALLKPPAGAGLIPRATNDANAPQLPRLNPVENMFVFFADQDGSGEPTNARLDVGEQFELEFEYQAVAAGNAEINCHIHASVEVGALLPRSGGTNGSTSVTILA